MNPSKFSGHQKQGQRRKIVHVFKLEKGTNGKTENTSAQGIHKNTRDTGGKRNTGILGTQQDTRGHKGHKGTQGTRRDTGDTRDTGHTRGHGETGDTGDRRGHKGTQGT